MLAVLTILFFASGACALVYQVMWLRLLALVFGVTVYAASTVLAGFMGGLAVGSFIAGRMATGLKRPLAAFGVVEALVGVTALATPAVLAALTRVWVSIHPLLPESVAVVTAMRFIVAFLVLIVPTSLMGATLPLVIKSAIGHDERIGGRIGWLYAVNTTGAIVGAIGAGFYLIAEVGVTQSFRYAAATNVLIGVVAVVVSFVWPQRTAAGSRQPAAGVEPTRHAQQRAVLWTFFLSGVMSLALEIIWFRMLVVFLRPTAYAFTIMLAAVLAGIALGSAIAAPFLRLRLQWMPVLTIIQALIGVAAVLSFGVLAKSQEALDVAAPWIERIGLNSYLGPLIVSSLIAMLPTTLLAWRRFPDGPFALCR